MTAEIGKLKVGVERQKSYFAEGQFRGLPLFKIKMIFFWQFWMLIMFEKYVWKCQIRHLLAFNFRLGQFQEAINRE